IEPMLDMRTLQQDAREIPFTNWLQGFIGRRGQDIVKGAGLPLGPAPAIRVTGVIDHLVLMTGAVGAFFDDEVLDAVVAGGADAPFPGQIEVAKFSDRDDVSAADFADFFEDAILNLPAGSGGGLFAIEPPAFQGSAVKKQLPPCCFFAGRELVEPR